MKPIKAWMVVGREDMFTRMPVYRRKQTILRGEELIRVEIRELPARKGKR